MAGNRISIMRIAHRVPRIKAFHGVKRGQPDGFYLTFVSCWVRVGLNWSLSLLELSVLREANNSGGQKHVAKLEAVIG